MKYVITRSDSYLEHHGIKGQKHGQRRFQNEDGSLTAEGRERYGVGDSTGNGGQGSSSSGSAKSGSFLQRHKKGLAIAGGILAAGLAGAAIYQISKNRNTERGAETVSEILKPKPDVPRTNVRPPVSIPKVDTKRMQRDSKKLSRNAAKAMRNNQRVMDQIDRMNADVMRRFRNN